MTAPPHLPFFQTYNPMRTIRASELGSYLYCKRAWWYQQQGVENQNLAELDSGSLYHQRHGVKVQRVGWLRLAGWVLLIISLVLLVAALTTLWLG